MQLKEVRLDWAGNPTDWCPPGEGEIWRHTHKGEGHVTTEAEVGVKQLQAQEPQEMPLEAKKR